MVKRFKGSHLAAAAGKGAAPRLPRHKQQQPPDGVAIRARNRAKLEEALARRRQQQQQAERAR